MGFQNGEYDVIVIGAGIAGLSTAALLSKNGYSVLILEKNKEIGGRAKISNFEGYILDWGIHFVRFGKYSKCAQLFKKIGKEINFLKPSPPLLFKNGEFSEFPKISPKIRRKLLRYFLFFPFNIKRFFRDVSVKEVLDSLNPSEELEEMMRILLFIALVCPEIEKASAREFRKFLKTLLKSRGETIGYPEGGWQKIFDSLKEEILKNGKILTNTKVRKILVENNEVMKLITEKGEFRAKCYILTIPLNEIFEIIDLNLFSEELQNYIKKLEPTSGLTLLFGLKRKISNLKSIIINPSPLSLGCFLSNIEKTLAPEDHQLGVWFCYLSQEEVNDEKIRNKKIEELKISLEEMFKNIWNFKLWEKVIFHKIVDGAAPKISQTYCERADFKSNIKNLFFAGDTTRGIGWGGDISFDSAIKCVELVKKYLKKGR